jgi:hypothetical protein
MQTDLEAIQEVSFVFGGPTVAQLRASLSTLGIEQESNLSWLPNRKDAALTIMLADISDWEIDLDLRTFEEWWQPLSVRVKQTLGVCPSAYMSVSVRRSERAFIAFEELTRFILERHHGIVQGSLTRQIWTVADIRSGDRKHGLTFFESMRRSEML